MLIRAVFIGCLFMLFSCASEYSPIFQQKGAEAMKSASYEEAVKAYDTSLNIKYHPYQYYDVKGDIDAKYGMYGEAVNDYTSALGVKYDGQTNMKRAMAYMKLKYYEDAEKDFTSIIMSYRELKFQAYAERAKAKIELGKYDEALLDLDRVIKAGAESWEVDKSMSEAYMRMGRTDKALIYAVKAVDKSSDNPELYYLRGKLFYKTKDANQALNDYKKALSLKPEYKEAKYALAWLYAACPVSIYRDGKQAEAIATELFNNDKTGDNAILLAAAYAEQGGFDKASELLKSLSDNEKNFELQDDMRVYLKAYQEKRTINTW